MNWLDILQVVGTLAVAAGTLWLGGRRFRKEQSAAEEKRRAEVEGQKEAAKKAAADLVNQVDARQNALVDQLQEQLKAVWTQLGVEREERRAEQAAHALTQAETRRRYSVMEAKVQHLEEEILQLRRGVAAGDVPPLPPRVPFQGVA